MTDLYVRGRSGLDIVQVWTAKPSVDDPGQTFKLADLETLHMLATRLNLSVRILVEFPGGYEVAPLGTNLGSLIGG